MQINLKQSEITAALKQYLSLKGIDLVNKTVDVSFTAGRKEGGLSAEITIDDQDIPGYSTGGDQSVLHLVQTDAPAEVTTNPEVEVTQPVEQESPVTEAPKTTSLFS